MDVHPRTTKASQGLCINTLGHFEVLLAGVPLTMDSRSSKMWDLLKYLITHRERNVAPEVLVEALWPDEDYDDAKGALRTLVYRLRKVLTPQKGMPDCIVSVGGGYMFDLSAVDFLDAEQFERLSTAGLQQKSAAILEDAAALYKGEYLKDSVFVEWAIPKRAYYRRLYLKIIGELVELLRNGKQYERAQEVCDQSLLIEPLDEGLNCHYLELLIAQGNHSKAQEHYSLFTAQLYREMSIKPSQALRSIYDRIKDRQSEIAVARELTEPSEGALVCPPDVFFTLCEIEAQRGQRNGYSVFLLEFTFLAMAEEYLADLGEKALDLLVRSLRKGDAVAIHEDSRVSILLSNLASKHAEMVVNRLYNKMLSWAKEAEVTVLHTYKQL